ncbi:site-specific integrase [Listeria monocytogenes]|nr:site-specific integrase [Listeria monocytogenes]EHT9627381.1 site-specific integrase [Listeria monocytogenes]TYU78772.1 site-specific integrase [Listeria monocytogenes]
MLKHMATIEDYKKQNKTFYRVRNLFLGRDEITGKKKYKDKSGFKTKKEAQRWIGQALEATEKYGVSGQQQNIQTYKQLYLMFLEHQRKTTKPSSVAINRRFIEGHVLPIIGNMKLKDIKPAFLQTLVYEWHDNFAQYAYIRKVASQVFKYGISLEIIETNPMSKTLLPRPKEAEKKLQFWTRQELKTFFEKLKDYGNPKIHAYFRLLAYTGMRKSEVLSLQWGDINYHTRKIRISKTIGMDEENKKYVSDTPKTKNSIRTITIDEESLHILSEWQNHQKDTFQLLGIDTTNPLQFIFTDKKNHIYYPTAVNDWLDYLIKKFGLPRITPHNLRHTHVSLLLEAGVPLKEVSERVGHKDSKITLEIYAHISQEQEERTMDTFMKYMSTD